MNQLLSAERPHPSAIADLLIGKTTKKRIVQRTSASAVHVDPISRCVFIRPSRGLQLNTPTAVSIRSAESALS